MTLTTLELLSEQLDLADQLLAGRSAMLEPQDLPGRYGRVVRAVDRVLQATGIEAVLGDGWAVWRHGYVGRVTQDVDVALPAERIDEFLRVASVSGFDRLPIQPGRWPKLRHKDTQIQVDILPEGARPETASRLAPTTIPHPRQMGARAGSLGYIDFAWLIVLKLAAGRARDDADVVELLRTHPDQIAALRTHVAGVHADYLAKFDELARRTAEQRDN